MQRALKLAELPTDASFYSLRHSHISPGDRGRDAVVAASPKTVGTSLLMIQRNYAKVLARTRRDVIQKTSPKLRRVK